MKEIMTINTPGIYYSMAYFCGTIGFLWHNSKEKVSFWFLKMALFALALSAFMVLTDDKPAIFFVPLMLCCIFFITVFIKYMSQVKWIEALYHTVRAFLSGEFMASLAWQINFYLIKNEKIPIGFLPELPAALLIYLLVTIFLLKIEGRGKKDNLRLYITEKNIIPVIIISIMAFFVSNLGYIYGDTPFSSGFSDVMFIIRTMVDLAGLSMLYAYHMQLVEIQIASDLQKTENMMKMQYASYKNSEETVALINQKYHDIKHQIAILRSERDSADFADSLDKIENEIKSYEAQNKTGNEILDTILTGKVLRCQQNNIEFTIVADGALLSFMDKFDMASLFGNALDNAIEASMTVENEKKRLIHLSIARQKAFIKIQIENRFDGNIRFENGIPLSRKEDSRYHGFGTKSIKTIVEKYGGSVNFTEKDNWFKLNILFNMRVNER
ncbi:MAG: ATP-binding protein [Lachnospiraceae bacterium]|nr:ATP-binding protein [Lachnospiraceae bacterium]